VAERAPVVTKTAAPAEPVAERAPVFPKPDAPAFPQPVARRVRRSSLEPSRGGSNDVEEHLVSLLAPGSFEAEQYRSLRHLIEQLHKSADLSVIAVSSPAAADGKTTTAINLAGSLAQAPNARVLLIDGDLRKPALTAHLGLEPSGEPGFVDAILDPTLGLDAVTRVCPDLNLSIVPAGHLPAAPYEVLMSPRAGELLAEARRRYDYIVVDTPPLVSIPDCRVIGKWVDGFLIVVTAHKTPRKLLEEALHVTEPAKVVGLVFNRDDRHLSRHSYTSYAPPPSSKRNGGGPLGRLLRNHDS
jgi:capsular exopolysaccharide synthesis family protein